MDSDIRQNFSFTIGEVDFVTGYAEQKVDAFTIVKSPEMLARYEGLLRWFERPNVLEVGMAFGGSMAWLNEVAKPRRLVGLDVRSEPIERLDAYVAEREAHNIVALYGIDQADRTTVRSIVCDRFNGELIDLVIDDASHEYGASKSLFETVFPYVRPGGIYLVEDWKWESELAYAIYLEIERGVTFEADPQTAATIPLTRLALDLVVARAESVDVIDSVQVDNSWIAVTRGDASLNAERFCIDEVARDFHALLAR